MDKEKKDLSFILILLSTLIGMAVLFQWAIINRFYEPEMQGIWGKLMDKQLLFRFLYVILIAGLAFLFPYRKPGPEDRKWFYTSLTLLAATALVAASKVIRWYNLFFFPVVFCRLHPACHQDVTLFLPPEGGLRFKYLRIEQRDISFLLRL